MHHALASLARMTPRRIALLAVLVAALMMPGGGLAIWQARYMGLIEQACLADPPLRSLRSHPLLEHLMAQRLRGRILRQAALRCLQNESLDRWGHQAVLHGALELIGESPDATQALAHLLLRPSLSDRTRSKATQLFLRHLVDWSRRAAEDGILDSGAQAYRRGFGLEVQALLRQWAHQGPFEQRAMALEALAGLNDPESIHLAVLASRESSRRLREGAWRAAWIHLALRGEAQPEAQAWTLLLEALQEGPSNLRQEILRKGSKYRLPSFPKPLLVELAWDADTDISSPAFDCLRKIDPAQAEELAWRWLQEFTPNHWAMAAVHLEAWGTLATPARLQELIRSPKVFHRFGALRIAQESAGRSRDPETVKEYIQVCEALRGDSDSRLAVLARWYAGDRSQAEAGGRARQQLFEACLTLNRAAEPSHEPVTAPGLRQAWLASQRKLVEQAAERFPVPPEPSRDPLLTELVAFLIQSCKTDPARGTVIQVPSLREKAGLPELAGRPPVLTADEVQVLVDEWGFLGGVIEVGEVFLDRKTLEAHVSLGDELGGRTMLLRKGLGGWQWITTTSIWVV